MLEHVSGQSVFVCQNERVLEILKERYLSDGSICKEDVEEEGKSRMRDDSVLGRLRGQLWPRMPALNRAFDLLAGTLLFSVIWLILDIHSTSTFLHTQAVVVADLLESTIAWLEEAPAGLKLNTELSQFVGYFFRYHIYLFRGYLDLLLPYLPLVIYTISLTCLLGFTCFLSYLLSFSIIFLLHLRCFYAYACNLYRPQLQALVSLGRLFAGIKYNPLRARVDSVHTQGDQLIIGTILFSTLLFLFPTTLLYYCVFTLANGTLLLVQSGVLTVISLLRSFPLWDFLRVVGRSEGVIDDVMIEPLSITEEEELGEVVVKERGQVFVVSPVYRTVGKVLRNIRLGGWQAGEVRKMALRGEIIKINFDT